MTYHCTNGSFDEVFSGEYSIKLKTAPKTILDIGANEGAFTVWALEQWPDARIESFEPIPANAAIFRQNINGDPRVEFFEVAVSPADKLELRAGLNNSGEWSAFYPTNERAVVIAECIHPKVLRSAELVKIDTEGGEPEILDFIDLTQTQVVLCEFHRRTDPELIGSKLTPHGFKLIERKNHCADRGVLKFAKLAVIPENLNTMIEIPDEMNFTGKTADGKSITLQAGHLRNEFYRPELRGKKLFIGVPVYSQAATVFMQCLLALQAEKPLPIEIHIGQGDGVARTRNQLTAAFLKSDCTHLLFIDCDLVFSADHIAKLLGREQDIIGGFYPKKQQGPLEWVINTLPGNPQPDETGMIPLKYVGTGFMCIARTVFEQMIAKYPEIGFTADYGQRDQQYDFWSMGVYVDKDGSRRYLSEDWYFCQRWLDMGGKIFGDASVVIKHYGPVTYPLDTQIPEIAAPKKRVEAVSAASDHAAPNVIDGDIVPGVRRQMQPA